MGKGLITLSRKNGLLQKLEGPMCQEAQRELVKVIPLTYPLDIKLINLWQCAHLYIERENALFHVQTAGNESNDESNAHSFFFIPAGKLSQ